MPNSQDEGVMVVRVMINNGEIHATYYSGSSYKERKVTVLNEKEKERKKGAMLLFKLCQQK
jgi:hypothetical protein